MPAGDPNPMVMAVRRCRTKFHIDCSGVVVTHRPLRKWPNFICDRTSGSPSSSHRPNAVS